MKDTSHASMHNLERWDDLRFFLVCAEEGSFSKAAQRLQVEQSTVSRRIQSLERALGMNLFTRTPEGVRMTELAEHVFKEAKETEKHIAAIFAQARSEGEEPSGTVRIAVTEAMAQHLLLPSLPQLARRFPKLRFSIITSELATDLVRGEADIALRFFRPSQGELVGRCVANLPLKVLTHPSYWKLHQDRSWEEQRWLTLDMFPMDIPESAWFQRYIRASSWLQTNSYASLMQAAQQGMGLALLISSAQRAYPELIEVETPFPLPPPFSLWLVTHAAQRHTPRIARVWEFLETLCAEM
ncbi:MAG: LysR family transcriptional regulator [Myxococcales bacterium]|nr:LysR family transcriptional regulator [Myxococcales bacterium]